MNLNRKELFEEMDKIGMFEEGEYTSEDFESICEDLADLIWFVDILFSENDFEAVKKLLLVIFHKYVKDIDLLKLLVTLGIVDEIGFSEDELLKVCTSLPDCIDFIDGISTNNDENTFKKLLLCILYSKQI